MGTAFGDHENETSRRRLWVVAMAMLAIMGSLGLGSFTRGARAANTILVQNGWDGNEVFYLTSGLTPATAYHLPTTSNASYQNASSDAYGVANQVNVSAGQDSSATNTSWFFDEYYVPGGSPGTNYMLMNIPIVAAAAEAPSGKTSSCSPSGPPPFEQDCLFNIGFQNLSLGLSSRLSAATTTTITTGQSGGLNVTPSATPLQPSAEKFLWDTMCAAPFDEIGAVCYATDVFADFSNITTTYQSNSGSNSGAPAWEKFTASTPDTSRATLGSETLVTVKIPKSEWSSSMPSIEISGQDVAAAWYENLFYQKTLDHVASGATGSIQIPIEPAVDLTGTVSVGGLHATNHTVVDIQPGGSSTIYQVYTNANGWYQFMAQPNVTYSVSAANSGAFGLVTSTPVGVPIPDSTGSAWANLTVPSLYGWVRYNSNPMSSATVAIVSPAGAEAYVHTDSTGYYGTAVPISSSAYSVGAQVYGYAYQPQSRVVNGNEAYLVDLNLTSVNPYPSVSAPGCSVTITVSSNGDCSVEIDSVGGWSGSVSLSDSVSPASGLTVDPPYPSSLSVQAWSAVSSYVQYFASSTTGTYTIYVTDSYATTSFTVTVKSLGGGGGGCVLAGTLIATPTGAKRVETLTAGDTVLGYNVTTGSWVQETVTSNTASTVNQVLSINKGLLVTTLTEQPLYVRNGTWVGWVHDPQNLTVGEQVFNPWTGSWITITSLKVLNGTFTVYDLRVTTPNDFTADGVLSLDKCSRCT